MGVTKSAGNGSDKTKSVDPTNDAQADAQQSRRESTQDSECFEQTGNFFTGAIKLGRSALMENLQHQRQLRDERNAKHAKNMSQWRADRERALADFESREARKRMKADEIGASLLKELRKEVCARFEKECRDQVREEVLRNRKTIEDDARASIAVDVRQELYQDLEPVVSAELATDMYKPVKKALQIDLRAKVAAHLQKQLYPVVRKEVESQLREELYPIIRKEIEKKLVSEFSGEIKQLGHPDWLEGLDPNAEKHLPSEEQISTEVTAATETKDLPRAYINRDDHRHDRAPSSPSLLTQEEETLLTQEEEELLAQEEESLFAREEESLRAEQEQERLLAQEEESLFIPQEASEEDGVAEYEVESEVDDLDIGKVQEVSNLDPLLSEKQSGNSEDVEEDQLPHYEKSGTRMNQEVSLDKEYEKVQVQEPENPKAEAVLRDDAPDKLSTLSNGTDSLGQDAQEALENAQTDPKPDQTEQSSAEAIHTLETDHIPSSNPLKDAENVVQELQSTAVNDVAQKEDSINIESRSPKFSAEGAKYRDRKRSLSSEGSEDDVDRAYKRIRPEGANFVQINKRPRDVYEDDGERQQSVEETAVEPKPKRQRGVFDPSSEGSSDDKEEDHISETGGDRVQGNIKEDEPEGWTENTEEEFDDEEDGEGYEDDEEEDYEGEEAEEDEEYETAPTNHHQLNQSAAVITETNTQETAFVIDDSDEEDAEADPERTLIGSPAFTSINKPGDAFQEDAIEEEEEEAT